LNTDTPPHPFPLSLSACAHLVVLRSRCLSGLPLVLCDIKIDSKSLLQRISSTHYCAQLPIAALSLFFFMALSCVSQVLALGQIVFPCEFQ